MIKTFGWVCYGIGLFVMLAFSGLFPAIISILIAVFAVWSTKNGLP